MDTTVPFPHKDDTFPSISRWREGHFQGRNGHPTGWSHFRQTDLKLFSSRRLPRTSRGAGFPFRTIPLFLLQKREFGRQPIAQMSEYQQFTRNISSFNNNNSFNKIFNFNTEAGTERHQILQWLSPLEPKQRHHGVRTNRLDGIGNWVLETNEFRKWSGAEDGCVSPVLFCEGNQGVGKTYLR